jgi:hypothetical protein
MSIITKGIILEFVDERSRYTETNELIQHD